MPGTGNFILALRCIWRDVTRVRPRVLHRAKWDETSAKGEASAEHEHDSGRAATSARSASVQSKDAALRDRHLRREWRSDQKEADAGAVSARMGAASGAWLCRDWNF